MAKKQVKIYDKYFDENIFCYNCKSNINRRIGISITTPNKKLNNDWHCKRCAKTVSK